VAVDPRRSGCQRSRAARRRRSSGPSPGSSAATACRRSTS
jgi:hypothetical protein